MGRAITEWEQNHGKSASEEARKRAEQRLAEVDKIEYVGPTQQEFEDALHRVHNAYRDKAYETLKTLYTGMKDLIEIRNKDLKAGARTTVSKQTVFAAANTLLGAVTLYHECIEGTIYNKDIDYMSKYAQNAFQEYAR